MMTDLIEEKKKELISTQDVVYEVLEKDIAARSSDNRLYYLVCKKIGEKHGYNIDHVSVPKFFLHLSEFGLPTTETVRRTRQKIQAANPWLSGNRYVRSMRQKNEQAFREYARKGDQNGRCEVDKDYNRNV